MAAIKSSIKPVKTEESLIWTDKLSEDIGLLDGYQDSTDRVSRNLKMLKLAVELFQNIKIDENERKIIVDFNNKVKANDTRLSEFVEILSDMTNCDVEQIGNGKELILF